MAKVASFFLLILLLSSTATFATSSERQQQDNNLELKVKIHIFDVQFVLSVKYVAFFFFLQALKALLENVVEKLELFEGKVQGQFNSQEKRLIEAEKKIERHKQKQKRHEKRASG